MAKDRKPNRKAKAKEGMSTQKDLLEWRILARDETENINYTDLGFEFPPRYFADTISMPAGRVWNVKIPAVN